MPSMQPNAGVQAPGLAFCGVGARGWHCPINDPHDIVFSVARMRGIFFKVSAQ